MAEITTIARPYAEAVFDLADGAGALAKWSEFLGILAGITAHPEVRSLLGNPNVSQAQLVELVASLAAEPMSPEALRFVRALVANGRLAAAPQVKELFDGLRHGREGTVDAEIRTAYPLDEAQLAALVRQLEARFKRSIQPQVRVDPALIGGVRIAVGDEVIESSVRGKLDAMAAALRA